MNQLPRNNYRLSIISSCNMKCRYCHNEGNTKIDILSKDDIEKLIVNSKDLGLKEIRLTGGEPLIHPQIYDICQMISEKYNLKIGINTNCVEIDKLLYMVKKGWINRVVVGLDYFDGKISKNSPIGRSSKEILNNIMKIKENGCDVSISSVYTEDNQNKLELINWGINHNIRIKIIEIIRNEKFSSTSKEFLNMEQTVKNRFNLDYKTDKFNETSGYIDGRRVVTFFHSHCRLRECDICSQIHLRITASGKMKQCMYTTDDDIDIRANDFREKLIKYLESPAKIY